MKSIFDLHCDTLLAIKDHFTEAMDTLNDPIKEIALERAPKDVRWTQLFAIWIPQEYRGEAAKRFYSQNCGNFWRQTDRFSALIKGCRSYADVESAHKEKRLAGILAVESGSALAGDLEAVGELYRDGVRAMTLTWNEQNELGSGNDTENGLTPFGKRVIREMESIGIAVDVSHLNDSGFRDVLDTARKPIFARHSNARAVCPAKRNLDDWQIKEIVDRNGIIGLTYCACFVKENAAAASFDELYRHIEHFLELGCENCLALGSDYDGAEMVDELKKMENTADIYGLLRNKGIDDGLIEKITHANAERYFKQIMG